MRLPRRSLLIAALFLSSPSSVLAQSAADPAGHWQGAIEAPGRSVAFEVDLGKNAKGEMAGTLSIPGQKLKGLPLAKVAVDGLSVTFYARSDQPLRGVLSDDGATMSGDFFVGGASVPFALTRVGAAKIEAPAKSAAVTRELEGTWNGTLDDQGAHLRLVLTMSNQPDGTAIGRIVNLDEGGLELPVVITQKASSVTLDSTVVESSFSGTLNEAGTELAGTFTQGPFVAPLTFRRAAKDGR
jgi:hypothetical protein